MSDKRIVVWVQRFQDRDSLMLQWIDPDSNKRKSKSAGTTDPDLAETKRSELEYELNHGLHKEASRMTWEKFRELFEAEYVSGLRTKTKEKHADVFNALERECNLGGLRNISARTLSTFVGALRQRRGSGEEAATGCKKARFGP